MFGNRERMAVCEQTEDAVASPNDIPVTLTEHRQPVAGEEAAVTDNTCCGHKLQAAHTAGPFLKFWGLERVGAPPVLDNRFGSSHRTGAASEAAPRPNFVWVGSILVVTKAPPSEVVVELQDAQGAQLEALTAEQLDSYHGWVALRYRLRVPVAEQEVKVYYGVTISGTSLHPKAGGSYHFYIAGISQATHWGFYSCSGFSADVPAEKREGYWKGLKPLWQDVMDVHTKKPLHMLVGGGDQLYCDDVWQLNSLKRFLDLPRKSEEEREAKCNSAYDDEMRAQVDAYYFHHYCCHFAQDPIADVYALVPQIMTWDDHDIFDGWGSYPKHLQKSTVFAGIFESANRWYCVFQQHCRPAEKQPVVVYEVGSRTAIVACDQREERHKDQILPLEHYMDITNLCTKLPAGIEHVIFVSTVPVVYPHILGATPVLSWLKNGLLQCMLSAVGVQPLNAFGEPELLDDINDHWSTDNHHDERRFLVEHLQMLAKYRGCRVSLLSGDVHVCGAGQLMSSPAPPDSKGMRNDFRYMPQIISSAIGNPPPPGGLMKILDFFGWGGHINKHTQHSMTRTMRNSVGVKTPLDNKRNWCEVIEHAANEPGLEGFLTFRLRIEQPPGNAVALKTHDIQVPPLEPIKAGTDEYFDVHAVARRGCF